MNNIEAAQDAMALEQRRIDRCEETLAEANERLERENGKLRNENAELTAYVQALEEQSDSIGLQKAQHIAGLKP